MTTYSRKVWEEHDIITTAAMNNIEDGVEDGLKFSETVIDGDKDMSGNALTNLGGLEVVGNSLLQFADYTGVKTKVSTTAVLKTVTAKQALPLVTATKQYEYTIPAGFVAGEVNLYAYIYYSAYKSSDENFGTTVYGTIKVNDEVVSSSAGCSFSGYATGWYYKWSGAVSLADLSSGDVIELWAYYYTGLHAAPAYVEKMELRGIAGSVFLPALPTW